MACSSRTEAPCAQPYPYVTVRVRASATELRSQRDGTVKLIVLVDDPPNILEARYRHTICHSGVARA